MHCSYNYVSLASEDDEFHICTECVKQKSDIKHVYSARCMNLAMANIAIIADYTGTYACSAKQGDIYCS